MDAIKSTIIICLIAIASSGIVAQQSPQYSLYMFNKFAVSPGYAGLDEQIMLNNVIRQQWSGLLGSPRTRLFSVNAPVGMLHGGIGITAQHQAIGAHRQTSAKLTYAYHQRIARKTRAVIVPKSRPYDRRFARFCRSVPAAIAAYHCNGNRWYERPPRRMDQAAGA